MSRTPKNTHQKVKQAVFRPNHDWIFSPDNPANQEDTPEFKHLRSINPAIDDYMILPNEYSGKGSVFKNCKYT